ncbi:MAG: replicative DNA helicase [Flavobacteriales bacterium]
MEDKNKPQTRRATRTQKDISAWPQNSKVPPQATDLEEAVLGAVLIDKEAVVTVLEILKEDFFYREEHRLIFKAISQLFAASQPVDIMTVTDRLRKNGELELVGGAFYIAQLTARVGSSANVEFHARIIAEKYIKRELITISSKIIEKSFDDTVDTFELLDEAEGSLFSVAENNIKRGVESVDTVIQKALKQLEEASNQEEGLTGVPSGYYVLDQMTAGWQKGNLIILAARPAMGKTSFALSLVRNAAVDFNKPVAIFSLEMSNLELVNRLIMSEADLDGEKLKKGKLTEQERLELPAKIARLEQAPVYIDDTAGLSIYEFRAKARKLKMQHQIQMIIIDYLQLMTAGTESKGPGNREQEISSISRSLKGIAKELGIPIIALSQLSRAVETRGGSKKPQLSDLRESGAIEQDADMVMFIYRPEYYELDVDENGNSLLGIAEIIIAKHRSGSVGSVNLRFVKEKTRFENLETSYVMQNNFDGGVQFDTITVSSKFNDEPF